VLEQGGTRAVQRAELLAQAAPRDIFWTRPSRPAPPRPPDPDALAI